MTTPLTALSADIITSETTVTATVGNPKLIIPSSGLAIAGLTWDTPSATDLDPWIAQLIRKLKAYDLAQEQASSTVHNFSIAEPSSTIMSRNNISNRLALSYYVTLISNQTIGDIDPDNF